MYKMSIGISHFGIGKKLIEEGKENTLYWLLLHGFSPSSHNNSLRGIFSLHFTEWETEAENKVKALA